MGLFTDAKNQSAFLKCGIMGFAGSGKTFTASKIAIGLHQYIKSDKPIFFLDTETGSDYLKEKLFDANNINLQVCKSRAFVDLTRAVEEAESNQSILIIDSITHHWFEFMDAFKRSKGVSRIAINHWTQLKEDWRKGYTEKYVNSHCHIIMCGRAGWDFDREADDEGVMELVKTGTKMRAESELGFEPSLLIEMEKVRVTKGKVGGGFKRRAWIIKDRFDEIDSHHFDDPDFDNFLPHIKRLNLGGEHLGVDLSKTSEEAFSKDNSYYERKKEKEILLEETDGALTLLFNNRTDAGKKELIKALKGLFGTSSRKAIEGLSNERLKECLDELNLMIEQQEKKGDSNDS